MFTSGWESFDKVTILNLLEQFIFISGESVIKKRQSLYYNMYNIFNDKAHPGNETDFQWRIKWRQKNKNLTKRSTG